VGGLGAGDCQRARGRLHKLVFDGETHRIVGGGIVGTGAAI